MEEKSTKERILEEALRLFAKNGYLGTSMNDIARQLGVTKAALYKHYTSKHTAPFFSDDEIKDAFDKHQDDISDYTIHDLAVTMNLMRSDHHVMLERYSKDADELKEMVVLMAIEYLQDPDCLHPTSKIWHTING